MQSLDKLDNTEIKGVTKAELILLLNEAAEHGATKALARIGLHDDEAVHDIKDLRGLLESWRETRKSIWATVIKVITVGLLGFIALAVWTEFKGRL